MKQNTQIESSFWKFRLYMDWMKMILQQFIIEGVNIILLVDVHLHMSESLRSLLQPNWRSVGNHRFRGPSNPFHPEHGSILQVP